MDSPTSAEVVEDFKDALQDLQSNSKPTIDVLTVIAKENTAHAEAISNVLVDHIKSTRPEWKLYGIYVLDSLIRHVGPPYSTYLSRNLYDTFMGAYRHVGERVRKDLEEVLWTWKEPPQGSRDPRPVLPIEATRKIETDVIKFRTIAHQHHQQQMRPIPGRLGPYRDSPIPMPMNNHPGIVPARPNGTPNPVDIAELMASLQQRIGTPQNQTSQYQPPPAIRSPIPMPAIPIPQHLPPQPFQNVSDYRPPYQAPTVTQPDLQKEVRDILQKASIQRMLEPNNTDLPQLINTLESLRMLLDSKQFDIPPLLQMQAELKKIDSRIQSQLSSVIGNPGLTQQQTLPYQPPTISTYPTISTPPPYVPPIAPTAPIQSNIPQIPPQFDIASLLSAIQPSHTSTPVQSTSLPPAPKPSTDNSLLSQLRLAGLLPSTPTPELKHVQPVQTISVSKTSGGLDQDSITKVRRPHLIKAFLDKNPDQCRQCGRRFPSTDEGKQRKTRHLDWHFNVNSRLADSSRSSIVHRSQYLNEMQWIKHREDQNAAEDEAVGATSSGEGPSTESEDIFVPLPTDSAKLNEPCSICMEPFKSVWHEKTQQPVWMDTIKVGDRYYHASCYQEVKGKGGRSRNGGDSLRGTPDPVLGKRKFAVDL